MKNSNIKVVNGMGKACRIICCIAMIFCIVGSVFALIGAGVVAAIPTDIIKVEGDANANVTVSIDDPDSTVFTVTGNNNGLKINYGNDGVDISSDKIDFGGIWSMDVEEVSSDGDSATYKITGDLGTIDKNQIKTKAVLAILEGFLKVTSTAVVMFVAMNLFKEFAKCETPFTEVIVKKMKVLGWTFVGYAVLIGLNITVIVAALAVLMLAYVFAHGVELQKQSDETL